MVKIPILCGIGSVQSEYPSFINSILSVLCVAQISYPDTLFEPAAVIEKKPTVPQESILKPTVDRTTKVST